MAAAVRGSGSCAAAGVAQTRRTRTAGKVDIPSVDDHVSKLEHMGRETVKKLSDVIEAAHSAGIDDLHIQGVSGKTLSIETVGAFQNLALAADHVRRLCSAEACSSARCWLGRRLQRLLPRPSSSLQGAAALFEQPLRPGLH